MPKPKITPIQGDQVPLPLEKPRRTMPQSKKALLESQFALNGQRAAALLDISTDTLERYRLNHEIGWIQGVHWFQLPGGDYRYNKELLEDWLANLHDQPAHQRAIENFRASLLSSKRRRSA